MTHAMVTLLFVLIVKPKLIVMVLVGLIPLVLGVVIVDLVAHALQ